MTQHDAGEMYGRGKGDSSRKSAEPKISQPAAAKLLNVSERSVQSAKRILREAPEKVTCGTGILQQMPFPLPHRQLIFCASEIPISAIFK